MLRIDDGPVTCTFTTSLSSPWSSTRDCKYSMWVPSTSRLSIWRCTQRWRKRRNHSQKRPLLRVGSPSWRSASRLQRCPQNCKLHFKRGFWVAFGKPNSPRSQLLVIARRRRRKGVQIGPENIFDLRRQARAAQHIKNSLDILNAEFSHGFAVARDCQRFIARHAPSPEHAFPPATDVNDFSAPLRDTGVACLWYSAMDARTRSAASGHTRRPAPN